jgi:hypothetical protein
MSAREDYPWPTNDATHAIKQHGVMCREIDRLRAWQAEAREEFEDIRSQFGRDYLWEKHNERPVAALLARSE